MEASKAIGLSLNCAIGISKRCLPESRDQWNRRNFSSFAVPTGTKIIAAAIGHTQSLRKRRPENVPGEFYVVCGGARSMIYNLMDCSIICHKELHLDHTCIDCDTCRWMAPKTFSRIGDMSAVCKQPDAEEDRLQALQALLSCPTNSIRTETPPGDILQVQKTFPIPIDTNRIPGVFHCGYHSEKSYGGAAYLIVHPEGNILVDSPRYTKVLARNIQQMGGARFMFLTHKSLLIYKDDIADHKKWAEVLNCERILHSKDINDATMDVERKLEGTGCWRLYDDIDLIHTPGHTEGSVSLFHKSLKILFTGDHLAMSEFGLSIFERYNQLSVPMQLESVRNILDLDFQWIMPGHGRRAVFENVEEKHSVLKAFSDSKMMSQTTT